MATENEKPTTTESSNGYGTQEFLWNLAGYKKEIVQHCRVDGYHASIIGLLVLMVGIYATIAWTFFFNTVFHDPIPAIVAGVFMGGFIVAFDRALIASLAGGRPNLFSLGFRFLLALLLGIFLSQPMILKFFEPEIKREAQILVDKKVMERKQELENLYSPETQSLKARKQEIERTLATKKADRDKAEKDFRQEMDGSGGTGKRGYKDISQKKETLLAQYEKDYALASEESRPQLTAIQRSLDSIQTAIGTETETFRKGNAEFGTLVQAEALESLMKKDESHTLRNRYYLLGIILTLIELSALIGKLIFASRSYTAKVSAYTDEEVRETEIRREIIFNDLEEYKRGKLGKDPKTP